ncbi:MAG TPA: hypothetical protein VFV99_01550, partial [Kofleriaceae bacterium]|nr:hypothetical protein [Kofleriaceae bacterium]
ARRASGQVALGLKIAACGFAGALLVNFAWGFVQFKDNLWEHEWIYKTADWAFFAVWVVVPIGLAVANWRERRELAIAIVVVSLLTWPPPVLAKAMYSWMPEGKSSYVIDGALRMVRFGLFLVGFAKVPQVGAVIDRVAAASGLRLAATSLWVRVIAAISLVLLTLMLVAGRGSQGGLELFKLATFTALIINIIAFMQFGVGALRTARGSVADLGRWPFVISGAISLWAAGVTLGQMPWLYRMLYKGGSSSFGSDNAMQYAQALAVAMPILITGGVALLAVAIAGFGARSGNEDLRSQAQAKGAGFVTLTLVSLAIQQWMIPEAMKKATSAGGFMMLSVLAAVASLFAIVMMAKLLRNGAEAIEAEPGLPPASVVSDGT